jgi:hypothetical protein
MGSPVHPRAPQRRPIFGKVVRAHRGMVGLRPQRGRSERLRSQSRLTRCGLLPSRGFMRGSGRAQPDAGSPGRPDTPLSAGVWAFPPGPVHHLPHAADRAGPRSCCSRPRTGCPPVGMPKRARTAKLPPREVGTREGDEAMCEFATDPIPRPLTGQDRTDRGIREHLAIRCSGARTRSPRGCGHLPGRSVAAGPTPPSPAAAAP